MKPINQKKIEEEIFEEVQTADVRENIWEKIAHFCFYFLAGLTPLFFLPLTIAPVAINKQILAGLLILAALVCYLVQSFKTGKIIYPKSLLSLGVAGLLLILIISSLFSLSKTISWFGNFVLPDSLINFFIYGLAFFLAAVLFKKENLKNLGVAFFVGLGILVLFEFLQIFGKFILPWDFAGQAGFNPVGNLSELAIFEAFGLAIIAVLLFSNRGELLTQGGLSKAVKILLSILGLLIILQLTILHYSSIWLSLALVLLTATMAGVAGRFHLNPFFVVLISLFLALGILNQSIFSTILPQPAEIRPNLSAMGDIFKGQAGHIGRIFLGSGPGTFSHDWALYRPAELNQGNLWQLRFNQGFSFLTTLAITSGILGLLAMLFLLYCFVRQMIGNHLPAIGAGILFLAIAWLFSPGFFTQFLFVFGGMGIITALSDKTKVISFEGLSKYKIFALAVFFVVLITAGFIFSFSFAKNYLSEIYYERGVRAFNQSGDLDKALIYLDKAIQLNSRFDYYFRDLSQLSILKLNELVKQNSQSSSDELRANIQNAAFLAINSGQRARDINPADSLNWSNLGNVYEKIIPIAAGVDIFSEESYKKAMELDPKNPQEPVNAARSLIAGANFTQDGGQRQDKINRAKAYLEKALTLKPDYEPAKTLSSAINQNQ